MGNILAYSPVATVLYASPDFRNLKGNFETVHNSAGSHWFKWQDIINAGRLFRHLVSINISILFLTRSESQL